jgi:hypothetical protein
MLPNALEIVLLYGLLRKLNAVVPNPYRTDLFLLLAASKSAPSFCLGNRATSLLQTLLQKMETFSFSCSLSNSQSLQERMTSHFVFFLL